MKVTAKEKAIFKAAMDYAHEHRQEGREGEIAFHFMAGVKWADNKLKIPCMIDALDYAAQLCAMTIAAPWVSLEEELPRIGQRVICISSTGVPYGDRRVGTEEHWRWQHASVHFTHWMPVPAIPTTSNTPNTD